MIPVAKGCQHIGCSRPVAARNLCETHYKRFMRRGNSDIGHASDRGQRERHPLYRQWCGIMRYHRLACDPRWHDFWNFVADVGEKPRGEWVRLSRTDPQKIWDKSNIYWKQVTNDAGTRASNSEKMRLHQRELRETNPDYFRDKDLRKNYGVSLAWYEETLEKQGHACAICKQPETMVIKGRVCRLAVDHCHDKGTARGLLCAACNRGIGCLQHSPAILRAALAYLDAPV